MTGLPRQVELIQVLLLVHAHAHGQVTLTEVSQTPSNWMAAAGETSYISKTPILPWTPGTMQSPAAGAVGSVGGEGGGGMCLWPMAGCRLVSLVAWCSCFVGVADSVVMQRLC